MSLLETAMKVQGLKKEFQDKIVMLGVDDIDMFKGISCKFLAMGHLLEVHPGWRGRVVLVQILNPARTLGKDIQEVEDEINNVAKVVNVKYGKPGYEPIVLVNSPVSTQVKVAYYAVSDCCLINCLRDGMNLVPYTYTVCRQCSPILDEALGLEGSEIPRNSVIVVSEFIGCSLSLSGAIKVNPWDVDSVSHAMNSAITMPDAQRQIRHEKHYKYISSHNIAYWARSFDKDFERASSENYKKRCWGTGFGLDFRVVAWDPNFRKLAVECIVSSYNKTNCRLILLDYDGTVMPQGCVNKSPSDEVIKVLDELSSDPKNVVFIVSGRGRDSPSKWFSPCEKLGLSAEYGYFIRWSKDSLWNRCVLPMNFDWKEFAHPVMEHCTEATDGSFIEEKESALVWHHQDANPDFGSWQATELLDHLENFLAYKPVVVRRGQQIVVVKQQGVSKGVAVERLIATMRTKWEATRFCVVHRR
ncbi:hypothetical protein ACSBR2_001625 [Camellia fascicularis]